MKKTLAVCVASALLAAAGSAWPQSPTAAPSPTQSPERPAKAGAAGLNLNLDEADKRRPSIMFGPRDVAGEQSAGAANSLPSLGGSAPRSFEGPSGKGPYPKDMNPGY